MKTVRKNVRHGACDCAAGYDCKRYLNGLIYHQGQHRTRRQAADFILSRPCWKGATVRYDGTLLVATKGTAELRIDLKEVA